MDPQLRASLLAGTVAGACGIVAFSIVHWLVVFPTWDTLGGFPIALLTGAIIGWAFEELRARRKLPGGMTAGPVFAGLLLLTLLAVAAASAALPQPPLERLRVGATLDGPALFAALLAAAPAGAAAGWVLTHSRRAIAAMALAGVALAVSLGHNIPFFATDPRAPKMWAVMVAVALLASTLLVLVRSRIVARWSAGA